MKTMLQSLVVSNDNILEEVDLLLATGFWRYVTTLSVSDSSREEKFIIVHMSHDYIHSTTA